MFTHSLRHAAGLPEVNGRRAKSIIKWGEIVNKLLGEYSIKARAVFPSPFLPTQDGSATCRCSRMRRASDPLTNTSE